MSQTEPRDALLLFEPVPQRRARANGWSAEVQRAFIAALAETGVVAHAARSVGRTARSAYALRDRDDAQGFSVAWGQAMRRARDAALGAARAHALEPRRVPVLYRGRIVGWRDQVDDRVLLAALRVLHARPAPPRPAGGEAAARRREAAEAKKRSLAIRVAEARVLYGGPTLWPDDLRAEYRRTPDGRAELRRAAERARPAAAPPPAPLPPRVREI